MPTFAKSLPIQCDLAIKWTVLIWKKIPSQAEQRAFVWNWDNERLISVPRRVYDEENNWGFEGTVTAKKRTTSSIRGKTGEVQPVFEKAVEAVPTTIVDVIELASERIEVKRQNTRMYDRQTGLKVQRVKTLDAKRSMCGQITAAKDGIEVLTTQLADERLALENLANESFWTKADL